MFGNNSSFLQLLGGLGQSVSGGMMVGQSIGIANLAAQQHQAAATLAIQGANLSAGAYRNAANSAHQVANYNIQLDRLNTNKQIEGFRISVRNLVSSQRASAATTGFATGSKSFLSIMSDTLSGAEARIVDMRNSASQRARTVRFEAELQATQLENQARAAEFSGQVQAWQSQVNAQLAQAQANRQRMSAISGAFGSLLG